MSNDKNQPSPKSCPGCGQPVNANGNCFNNSCWNAHRKRNQGIGR
jgi:hypothetical protein